ncbi:hypothetical protein VIN01S_24220 [Vibrio inusitatus NBRC 102082]|uniref:HTH araC/xylS-type domain-containing protein n=1 Tax=Vibrio inusitatus NBRC 102082 TaxID=1219070 RepID=A0A4Y3HX72_9VIBR|nr:hypothetical protein VIN01S_24220 [Vibrio inusitatus NBRC 102082]
MVQWHSNFTDTVFTALYPYVKDRNLTVVSASKLLNMTPRTFQRRLTEEKTNFRNIKDNLIYTAAVNLMAKNLSLTHIVA